MENSVHYTLDESENFLRVTLFGAVEMQDVVFVFDAISDGATFRRPRRLWDLRSATLELTNNDLIELASIGKSRDIPGGRGAILVDEDLNFGLSRTHRAFRESEKHEIEIFRDEAAAVSWLNA